MTDLAKDVPGVAGSTMFDVPKFILSGFNGTMTPVEVVILGSSLMPGVDTQGELTVGQRPEIVMSLSPQAAKELHSVLGTLVKEFEAQFGEIRTPFLDEQKSA